MHGKNLHLNRKAVGRSGEWTQRESGIYQSRTYEDLETGEMRLESAGDRGKGCYRRPGREYNEVWQWQGEEEGRDKRKDVQMTDST